MKNNRKGFTIVELVIVIAVIGILAGVLIPTFSSITKSANESAALQQAKSGLQSILPLTGGALPSGTVFAVNSDDDGDADYKFIYEGQKLNATEIDEPTPVQTTGSKYIIYVSTESLVESGDSYTGFDSDDLILLNSLLADDDQVTAANTFEAKGSHYVLTIHAATVDNSETTDVNEAKAAVTADVYFTSDIKGTMMVVLGNMAD